MSDRNQWATTTHAWGADVDRAHLDAIQARRGHYGAGGIRHLILEVLAYADDEAAHIGRVGRATVTHHRDGAVTVADDGRGTDTRTDSAGQVVRKPVAATPDVRFFDSARPTLLPDGHPRHGLSVVAALSSLLVHENHRATGAWLQTYRHGIPGDDLREVTPTRAGTSVTFRAEDLDGPVTLTDGDRTAFSWLSIQVDDRRDDVALASD